MVPGFGAMMYAALLGLAQGGSARENMTGALRWGAILLIAGLLLGGGVMWLRRRVLPKDEPVEQTWSLRDLRRMRDAGDITPEEYETLRSRVIAEMGGPVGAEFAGEGITRKE